MAAALAYYAILSIPPLLILIITLVGQFTGAEATRQAIVDQVRQWIGAQAANSIQTILDAAAQPINLSLTALVSLAVLFFSASGVFVQLQGTLNTIWNVMPDPEKGIMNTVRKRVFSFVMILAVGLLFLILLLASSVVAFLGNVISQFLPGSLPVLQVLNVVLGIVMLTLVIALIYKTLPDAEIKWRDVWMGSAVTAVLLLLGIVGIGLYLQYSDVTSSYGAAGSLIVLMIWVYFSAQIFFLGAEFTQVYANLYGSRILPEEGAVRVERVTQTQKEMSASPPGSSTGRP